MLSLFLNIQSNVEQFLRHPVGNAQWSVVLSENTFATVASTKLELSFMTTFSPRLSRPISHCSIRHFPSEQS